MSSSETVSQNVGTELLFENDRVRVWDMTLEPGQSSELHRHLSDYVFAYVTPTLLESRTPGEEPKTLSLDDGYVQFNVVGTEGMTHQVTNVGDRTHRQILVELLGPSASETAETEIQTNGRTL
jgi:beta-alanine degradation protein BauB